MNPYNVLELSFDATKEEIKKAYRKLALKYHPDRNKTTDAGQKMRLINEAYKILMNQPEYVESPLTYRNPSTGVIIRYTSNGVEFSMSFTI